MKKVIYYTKYTRKGASSRMRSYQYFPFLKKNGFDVTISPFFDDSYLEQLYSKKRINKILVLKNYIRRFYSLFFLYKYDIVVIEKELFPYSPAIIEQLLSLLNVKYVVDYDDALFHLYDQNPNKLIRFFLRNKIDIVMRNSKTVICGNDYLADRAKKAGAKKITIIPTVIDLERYILSNKKQETKTIIGWVGTPESVIYLKTIETALLEVVENLNVEIQIIGGIKGILTNHEKFSYINWSEEQEVKDILNFDIGVMPLTTEDWAKGKCAYKIIQYMGCGLPVVSSPVGMNVQVVDENINGFFATTPKEWVNALIKLVQNKELRTRLGNNGRKKVEREYSLQMASTKLISSLNNLIL